MTKTEKTKRYICLIIGLILNSFGVALVAKGGLGSSPVASISYSLSLAFPRFSLGTWCAAFDIFLVFLQLALLKGKMGKRNFILQILLSFGFGIFCDLGTWVFSWVGTAAYYQRLLCLFGGILFFSFGINFELTGNISMLPGNAVPKVIAQVLGKEYGPVRVVCDVTCTAISAVISLIKFKALVSVREGTIIAAVLVGNMVKLNKRVLGKFWNGLAEWVNK